MNLSIDNINPTVLNNYCCLPTYDILFINYDFGIRQHNQENVRYFLFYIAIIYNHLLILS